MPTHHSRRLARAAAAVLAIGALTAGTAVALSGEAVNSTGSSSPPVQSVTRTGDNGFDWGSAGIGAGAGTAIVLLSLGGIRAGSRVNQRPGR